MPREEEQTALAMAQQQRCVIEIYRTHLLTLAGHDLRNPLAAITMAAGILAREGELPADRRIRNATRIASSATRMGQMVDELLDYTQIMLGPGIELDRTSVDLDALVNLAATAARAREKNPAITVETAGDLRGSWDEGRVQRVLERVLSAIRRHTPPETVLQIRGRRSGDPSGVEIEVSGRETTLSDDILALWRGEERAAHTHGLGPFMARQIVEAHGGWLRADVSCITFWLPL